MKALMALKEGPGYFPTFHIMEDIRLLPAAFTLV